MSRRLRPAHPADPSRPACRWQDRRWLGAVLLVGTLVRAVLVPITHGPDFLVWDLASKATLEGVNIYAHHPAYHGGPYAYLPLFLYLELPLQWVALHTGASFTIFGKLPIVAGDLLAALLLAEQVGRAGGGDRSQALAAGLYFLNPLVIYDGAFYGRFDSVCVALFLLAIRAWRPGRPASWRFGAAYALAIAAKTYPIAALPWLLCRGRVTAARVAVTVAGVVGALCAPYLIGSPYALVRDQLYSYAKLSGSLSWQVVFHPLLPAATQVTVSQLLLLVFALAAVGVAVTVADLVTCAAATTLLFIVLSKVVIEQYLIWPLPFLILLAVNGRSRAAALLTVLLSAVGFLVNPYIHPFGTQPAVIDVLLAGAILAGLFPLLRRSWLPPSGRPGHARRTPADQPAG